MRLGKCCDPNASKIFKIKLGTGLIGIMGLDRIMSEVRSLGPLSKEEAKRELLERAAANNYIPASAKEKYAESLYREYLNMLSHHFSNGN